MELRIKLANLKFENEMMNKLKHQSVCLDSQLSVESKFEERIKQVVAKKQEIESVYTADEQHVRRESSERHITNLKNPYYLIAMQEQEKNYS